jgi:hypothetical protein
MNEFTNDAWDETLRGSKLGKHGRENSNTQCQYL